MGEIIFPNGGAHFHAVLAGFFADRQVCNKGYELILYQTNEVAEKQILE